MKNQKNILATGAAIGAINVAYYTVLDFLPASGFTISMLGFVSLIVLAIGVYLGLRRLSVALAAPPSFLKSLGTGMAIAWGAALTVILLRIVTTAVSLSMHESLEAYFASTAPLQTLFWYSLFGLVYCTGVHWIIRYQYTKSKKQ